MTLRDHVRRGFGFLLRDSAFWLLDRARSVLTEDEIAGLVYREENVSRFPRWNGLWRRGAGTPDDPDNGRLILTWTGVGRWLYTRKFENFAARWRARYWIYVRRHRTEKCRHCGRPVGICYIAPDWIWEAVTGNARWKGQAGAGILCPSCLSDLARANGLPYLRWSCSTTDDVYWAFQREGDGPPR
jgi:hypothetical protein